MRNHEGPFVIALLPCRRGEQGKGQSDGSPSIATQVSVPAVPCTLDGMVLCMSFYPGGARGEVVFEWGIEHPDGRFESWPFVLHCGSSRAVENGITWNEFDLSGYPFPLAGVSWFRVLCGGRELARAPLRIQVGAD